MHRLKSVGVLSCAKMFGVLYGCMGLIFIPFALIGGMFGILSHQTGGAMGGAALLVLAVLAPVIYGVMGFLLGALTAWVYNLVAKWMGGIELELQGPIQPGTLVGSV